MKNIQLIILLFLAFQIGQAQNDTISIASQGILYPTDSIPVVSLDSIYILPKLHFSTYIELRHFRWIRRKVYKVYPFAKMSGENFVKLEERLAHLKTKRQKKHYIRIVQRWIEKEFTPQLKEFTQTEGRILSKLLHRQTGETSFQLLKKYKSGWTAFWYQRLAKLNNIDLKQEFDPMNSKEDYWIEYILQQAFLDEILDPQTNKLGYKFIDLQNKWNKAIPHKKRIQRIKQEQISKKLKTRLKNANKSQK